MFADRTDAGRVLAEVLVSYAYPDPVVIGLARGGVVVAAEVARVLAAPLDVAVVRKLGAPQQPELALGAIAEDGAMWLNENLMVQIGLTARDIEPILEREAAELARRLPLYRAGREPQPVSQRTAIVIDDGLATGATARAALRWVRAREPSRVVLAVPVGAPDVVRAMLTEADEVVCVEQPPHLLAVGAWYEDFAQVDDEQVVDLLSRRSKGSG